MGVYYCMWGTSDFISPVLLWMRVSFSVTSVSVLITSLSEVSEMALLEEELPGVSKGESLNVELAKGFRPPEHACNKS